MIKKGCRAKGLILMCVCAVRDVSATRPAGAIWRGGWMCTSECEERTVKVTSRLTHSYDVCKILICAMQ